MEEELTNEFVEEYDEIIRDITLALKRNGYSPCNELESHMIIDFGKIRIFAKK